MQLAAYPPTISSKYTEPHYILLDTNVVLDQIDILEDECIKDVIVLYTVIEEVKHKSSAIFKRFRNILLNPSRRFYTFVNEHHINTYVRREKGESANDRNDRAIRIAAKWYENHLNLQSDGEKTRVILITDDANNRVKAHNMDLISCSMSDYVRSCDKFPSLLEKLSQKNTEFGENKIDLFSPHFTPAQIHEGIRSGKLLQGSFVASRDNFLEGFVNVEGYEKTVST